MKSAKPLALAFGIGLADAARRCASNAHAQYGYPPPPRAARRLPQRPAAGSAHRAGRDVSAELRQRVRLRGFIGRASHRRHGESAAGADGRSSGPCSTPGRMRRGQRHHHPQHLVVRPSVLGDATIVWLKGGLGLGACSSSTRARRGSPSTSDEWGLGIMGGGGRRGGAVATTSRSISSCARALFLDGGDLNQVAALIGINWY